MAGSGELMVETKSRLTLLVVEDNPQFAANVLEGLKGHDVMLATTLEDALASLAKKKPDFIVSDVYFPGKSGDEPKENITPLMHAALESGTPICFVTKADHHGLTEKDEGFIAIVPLTLGETVISLMEINRSKDEKAFRSLKSSKPERIKSDAKTPDIWARALESLRNACETCTSPVNKALNAVRSVGLEVGVEKGLPIVRPQKKLST